VTEADILALVGRPARVRYTGHLGQRRERVVKPLRTFASTARHFPTPRPEPVIMLEAEEVIQGRTGSNGPPVLLNIAIDDIEAIEPLRADPWPPVVPRPEDVPIPANRRPEVPGALERAKAKGFFSPDAEPTGIDMQTLWVVDGSMTNGHAERAEGIAP
jgi:hypothetical protein